MSREAQNKPTLTLAMIVRNDVARLEQTLAAVASAVDEIVVCDTGEESGVAACVAPYGGRVIEQPWCDSFAIARNECLRHARGQWILWLDAGETIDAGELQQLREHIAGHAPNTAYMLLVKTPPTPGALDGEQVARVRLVPGLPGIHYVGRVRETLHASLAALNIPIEGLGFRILRPADEHDAYRCEMRARRNIELADLELREVGPQPRLLNCLGEAFQILGEPGQARAYYQHSIDRAASASAELLEAYYGLLTLENPSAEQEAKMQICLRALDAFPLDMQLLCAMGGYLQTAGRWDLALRSYETAYRFGQIHPEVWHMDHLRGVAAECYALSLQLQGKLDDARQALTEALANDATCHRVRRQLLDMLVKQGQRDEALALVDRNWPGPDREAMRSAVRGASLAAIQNWIAARAYLQVAYQAGCREALCLRWLSITLIASGAADEARAVLQEWSRLEPHNLEPRRLLETLGTEPSGTGSKTAAQRALSASDRQLRIDATTSAGQPASAPPAIDAPAPIRPTVQR